MWAVEGMLGAPAQRRVWAGRRPSSGLACPTGHFASVAVQNRWQRTTGAHTRPLSSNNNARGQHQSGLALGFVPRRYRLSVRRRFMLACLRWQPLCSA